MQLRTSVCQRTRSLEFSFAVEDLRALGPAQWISGTNTTGETTEDTGEGKELQVAAVRAAPWLLPSGAGALLVGEIILVRGGAR